MTNENKSFTQITRRDALKVIGTTIGGMIVANIPTLVSAESNSPDCTGTLPSITKTSDITKTFPPTETSVPNTETSVPTNTPDSSVTPSSEPSVTPDSSVTPSSEPSVTPDSSVTPSPTTGLSVTPSFTVTPSPTTTEDIPNIKTPTKQAGGSRAGGNEIITVAKRSYDWTKSMIGAGVGAIFGSVWVAAEKNK